MATSISTTSISTTSISTPSGAPPDPDSSGLFDLSIAMTHEVRELLHDQLQLVAAETQLATHSLLRMLAASVVIGVLLVTAWVAFTGAWAFVLIVMGLTPAVAMLIAAALNLVAMLFPLQIIRRHMRNLGFPATLRTLKPGPASDR